MLASNRDMLTFTLLMHLGMAITSTTQNFFIGVPIYLLVWGWGPKFYVVMRNLAIAIPTTIDMGMGGTIYLCRFGDRVCESGDPGSPKLGVPIFTCMRPECVLTDLCASWEGLHGGMHNQKHLNALR